MVKETEQLGMCSILYKVALHPDCEPLHIHFVSLLGERKSGEEKQVFPPTISLYSFSEVGKLDYGKIPMAIIGTPSPSPLHITEKNW